MSVHREGIFMPPSTLPTNPTEAYALGAKAGGDKSRIAGECPYDHEALSLRTRWMDGFSSARGALGTAAFPPTESSPAD